VKLSGICGEQSGVGAGFLRVLLFLQLDDRNEVLQDQDVQDAKALSDIITV
jgi:hypothetical protein